MIGRLVWGSVALLAVLAACRGTARHAGASGPADTAMMHDMHHHLSGTMPADSSDSAFAELQERGRVAMGVDQYTSRHVFESLPDGGRIELQRDSADSVGTARIRRHLQTIAQAFAAGNFDTPAFVHMRTVPGTRTMADRRALITYTYSPLPRGGELRITTHDSVAVAAVHDFLAFQRQDHRTDRR